MSGRIIVVTIFVLALATAALAADNPFVGTWKLNVERSSKAANSPKSDTYKSEAIENGLKITRDAVNADGTTVHTEQVVVFDGKDHPYEVFPPATAAVCSLIGDSNYACLLKRDGQEMLKIYDVVSGNGRTQTLIFASRQTRDFVVAYVYEKQ